MPELSDTQTILLSAAAQRDDRSLFPLPASLKAGAHIGKAVAGLAKAGLAKEEPTDDRAITYRTDDDLAFAVFATDAGLAAIGVDVGDGAVEAQVAIIPPGAAPTTKIATVLALLAREDGATLADLVAATGWLPHTIRAALTGLRKKGYAIAKTKRDGVTCYRIAAA